MKHIFLDTNIIIDLVADRKPFSKYALEIFSLAEKKQIKLFATSHSLVTTHYMLKRFTDEKALREILLNLLDFVSVIPVNGETIKKGLRSRHKDFEDAVQIMAASSMDKMDYITTRNIKDFKHAELPVFPPDELISKLKKTA